VRSLLDHLRAMARNNAWSNHRLLRACALLDETAYAAPRDGFFPSIQATLDHILAVDVYYLDMLHGRPRSAWAPVLDFATLEAAQRRSDARLIAFCDALDENRAGTHVLLERDDGPRRERVHAVLSHLFIHQIHHRGQVHAMLSGTSVAPPQLDEFFLDQDAELRRPDFSQLGWPSSGR
jgi:uncharacterized damage-inducible protein DinB